MVAELNIGGNAVLGNFLTCRFHKAHHRQTHGTQNQVFNGLFYSSTLCRHATITLGYHLVQEFVGDFTFHLKMEA
jgi:hypothetical protein